MSELFSKDNCYAGYIVLVILAILGYYYRDTVKSWLGSSTSTVSDTTPETSDDDDDASVSEDAKKD